MLQEIWPQIISAVSALSGFLVSQLATEVHEFYSRKHQRKILLREKFEEMLFHFSASLEYLVYLNGSTSEEAVYALAQCRMLARR